jgi:hypothetical protein
MVVRGFRTSAKRTRRDGVDLVADELYLKVAEPFPAVKICLNSLEGPSDFFERFQRLEWFLTLGFAAALARRARRHGTRHFQEGLSPCEAAQDVREPLPTNAYTRCSRSFPTH